jgi:hypothetical protein
MLTHHCPSDLTVDAANCKAITIIPYLGTKGQVGGDQLGLFVL